jgi:hypothetical protein
VLKDAFENEPGLADVQDNFDDLLNACRKDGPLQCYFERGLKRADYFNVGATRLKSMIDLMYGFNESPFVTRIREATESG